MAKWKHIVLIIDVSKVLSPGDQQERLATAMMDRMKSEPEYELVQAVQVSEGEWFLFMRKPLTG